MESNWEKQKKTAKRMLIAALVLVVLYIAVGIYSDNTGKIETEYALKYTQEEVLCAEAFAVRDENHTVNKKNTSVLIKNDNLVYVPSVTDGESVAVNDVIAVTFTNDEQADDYTKIQQYKKKIDELRQLSYEDSIKGVNVTFLNSQIYSSVTDYVDIINSGNLSELSAYSSAFTRNVTTKQIATGTNFNVSAKIKEYQSQIASLNAGLKIYKEVKSPYAGYFVSEVDGFESTKSYKDVKDGKISHLEAEKLLKAEGTVPENAYGKIIGQHTWYLVFDVSVKDASIVKTGADVYVDFSEHGIYDIKMTVHSVTEPEDGKITVALACKTLNESLINLRKEKIEITLTEHEGFRISSDALVQNDEGLMGVYVLHGNIVRFTPINVLYYGNDYVIAGRYIAYKKNKKGEDVVDEEKTALYRELKTYDNIIVKGTNLEDGIVIS